MPLPPHIQRRGVGACLRLPALTAEEAWTVAAILEGVLDNIWRVHGDAMADYQGRMFPDWNPSLDAEPYRPDQSEPEAVGDIDF
jgi:hypothetical protein